MPMFTKQSWFVFLLGVAIRVRMSGSCLLNGLKFFNPNMTYLLNGSIVSTFLSDFINKKTIYEKTNK